jgi:hypothetical protein
MLKNLLFYKDTQKIKKDLGTFIQTKKRIQMNGCVFCFLIV